MSDVTMIPESASDVLPDRPTPTPGEEDAFILNPSAGQELLTPEQAIDLINHISGVLLIHERSGRRRPGIAQNQEHLRTS
jgi:hypothetical protein